MTTIGVDTKAAGSATRPTLSVILCVDRQTPFLQQAIDSILTQRDSDFQFLIAVNGGSADLKAEIRRITSSEPRTTIFESDIRQLAFNLNLLADHASGDYLVRMDADDISEPDRIQVLKRELQKRNVDVLGSWCRLIDESGHETGMLTPPETHEEIVRRFPYRNVIVHPATAIRRALLLELRGYLGGFNSEDSELWLRAIRAGARFENVPIPLLRYRLHPSQVSAHGRGYFEMAGHWLRDLLTSHDLYALKGFSIAFSKAVRHKVSKRLLIRKDF